MGVPVVVHPDGSVHAVPAPGFVDHAKAAFFGVVHVLASRPMRPYEAAIGLACLKALEKAFGFKIGF